MSKQVKILLPVILAAAALITMMIYFAPNKEEENGYDVSMMNEVNVEDILDMFESGKTYVVFVGRKGCSVCEKILPALEEAQKKNNYITQYLDLTKVDRSSEDWEKLVGRLIMRSTQTLGANGEGEEVTETYGYFLHYYGFTPTLIVIKDGKQTAGFIGGAPKDELVAWLTTKINGD